LCGFYFFISQLVAKHAKKKKKKKKKRDGGGRGGMGVSNLILVLFLFLLWLYGLLLSYPVKASSHMLVAAAS
jgi:hypothetical protein